MRLNRFLFIIILLSFISCKRTPSSIIRAVYGIDLKKTECTVVDFSDEWMWADGETSIIMKIDSLSKKNYEILKSKGAKPLPLTIKGSFPNWLKNHLSASNGLYILNGNPDLFSYSILVYDEDSRILIYYTIEI